ncbi:MAG: antimicrobial peptide transporter, ATPase component [Paenibacillaceae bacterium]|jgi:putative ABC transport system ATP-binding protein|nr:antimicrobial peptide transporter, ATPase component [Paenibacillaceae bacterium]
MGGMIEFKNVTKSYQLGQGDYLALNQVSFTIDEGEFVVILGPSGAGKSTVLNLLGGMDTATSGDIIVNGNNITACKDKELTRYRAENVGFVFQFYNLLPTLTALENVALTRDIVRDALDPSVMLASVGLGKQASQFPSQLSGGEQQRVSIARAICKNPTMLLCDEPTGALDSETGIVILSLLQQMSRENNKTVIIVTHNSALAQAADKIIRIKNGMVQEVVNNEHPASIREVAW